MFYLAWTPRAPQDLTTLDMQRTQRTHAWLLQAHDHCSATAALL